jgi:hypothetical protein
MADPDRPEYFTTVEIDLAPGVAGWGEALTC